MTEDRWEDTLAQLIEAHVSGKPLADSDLDEAHSRELVELLNVADLLWEAAYDAPALEHDPVAAMLGLIPDSARSLDSASLKRALQTGGLQLSGLAEALSARGWDVTTRDVFNWQTRDTGAVPPALIQAIAEVTGVPSEELTTDRGEAPANAAFKSVTSSTRFRDLARRWSRLRGTTLDLAASDLEAKLATSVYRGIEPNQTQMLDSLEALVSTLEEQDDDVGRD